MVSSSSECSSCGHVRFPPRPFPADVNVRLARGEAKSDFQKGSSFLPIYTNVLLFGYQNIACDDKKVGRFKKNEILKLVFQWIDSVFI